MKSIVVLFFFIFLLLFPVGVYAQELDLLLTLTPDPEASVSATPSATLIPQKEEDVTQPEQPPIKKSLLTLLQSRNVDTLTYTNVLPFAEAYAIEAGVPANTIILIMLLPIFATIIVGFRYLIGLNSMGLLVPIALSIALLATDIVPGFVLLSAILLGSWTARILLKKVRIMQMPKMVLSMFVVAVFLFVTLLVSAKYQLFDVQTISIFPILLFMILSDRIVALFLERSAIETLEVLSVTLILSMIGFMMLSWEELRNMFLVYPELVLLVIPANILMGRYSGLRMTEYFKFQPALGKIKDQSAKINDIH